MTVTVVEMYAHFEMSRMWLKYQPSGTVGTRSPHAKSKMGARGPQNGRWGLERCLSLANSILFAGLIRQMVTHLIR